MSILLESLSQQADKDNSTQAVNVPNIHAAHFDDEMLGDEWLMKRLLKWKLICLGLFILLLASWSYWIFQPAASVASFPSNIPLINPQTAATQSSPSETTSQINTASSVNTNSTVVETPAKVVQNNSLTNTNAENSTLEMSSTELSSPENSNTESSNTESQAATSVYHPKKRAQVEPTQQQRKKPTKISSDSSRKASKMAPAPSSNLSDPITREELPLDLQDQFPEITIDSYVVADSQADSFVILEGEFYTVNQVIAPNLILRDISNQQIIVEFHSQWVKIPLN